MKKKIGTLATCAALAVSVGAPATSIAGGGDDNFDKCVKLTKKYEKAIKKGQEKKAEKILKKAIKAGCAG